MVRRANPWPALVDLFSALLLPVFGGLILLSTPPAGPSSQQQIEDLKKENKNNQQIIKVVKDEISTDAQTPEDFQRAIQKHREDVAAAVRRGKPKCQDANTLVYISLVDRRLELLLREGVEKLPTDAAFPPVGRFVPGRTLTDPQQIDRFLLAVERYHALHGDCRFDYRLTWKTDSDYRLGRSRFERYFYPESILSAGDIIR